MLKKTRASYLTPSMKSALIIILLTMGVIGAKAQSPLTPRQYSDRMIAITDSLYDYGQGWASQFRAAMQMKDFSILKPYRERMLAFIDANTAAVKGTSGLKPANPLGGAMLAYLDYERRIVSEGFASMETLSETSNEEEIKGKMEALRNLGAAEGDERGKLLAAQNAYAKENGFTIEQ